MLAKPATIWSLLPMANEITDILHHLRVQHEVVVPQRMHVPERWSNSDFFQFLGWNPGVLYELRLSEWDDVAYSNLILKMSFDKYFQNKNICNLRFSGFYHKPGKHLQVYKSSLKASCPNRVPLIPRCSLIPSVWSMLEQSMISMEPSPGPVKCSVKGTKNNICAAIFGKNVGNMILFLQTVHWRISIIWKISCLVSIDMDIDTNIYL